MLLQASVRPLGFWSKAIYYSRAFKNRPSIVDNLSDYRPFSFS